MKALDYFYFIFSDKSSVLSGCKREEKEFIRDIGLMSENKNRLVFQKQKLMWLVSYVPVFLPCPRMVLTVMEVENKTAFLNIPVLVVAHCVEKPLNKSVLLTNYDSRACVMGSWGGVLHLNFS